MNNGGQSNSSDYRAMAPFVNVNPFNSQEYASRKAKIEEAKRKLVEMELQNELEEIARQGREAEQRLAEMKASMAAEVPVPAGLPSASGSSHYPNAVYHFAEEVPLTARIEGEIRDTSPNSSRPQMPYNYQHNYPSTNQSQQAGFQAHVSTQPPSQRPSFAQTQSQGATRSQSSHAPYPRGPAFTVRGYQHSQQASSTPHQQHRFKLNEEYWAKQSQKYAAELAGASAQTSQAGVKPRASTFTGTGIPQYAPQVQHQVASPAAPAVATIVSSTGRPSLSSAEQPSTNRQSSGSLAQSAITKPEFIRQFQLACNHGPQAIQDFLSSCPVAVEWWAEAARSLNPQNFKDEGVFKMLNDMRNLKWTPLPRANYSASAGTNVHVPTGISATSGATIQPLPLPLPANPLPAQQTPAGPGTKEAFVRYFHERFQGTDMDVTVKFLMQNLHSVPEEWRKALFDSLAPEFKKELGQALTRAKALAASKTLPVTSAATPNTSSDRVPTVAQQSRTTTASNAVTPATAHTTSESSKSIPVPPRPSVTKNTQAKSTSVQPPRALTSNPTAATTVAALATKATPAPQAQVSASTTQTALSASSIQQATSLTGTSIYGQAAGGAYKPLNVPPPMSIPSADGKVAQYAYDPYLKKYVRADIPTEDAVPSGSNTGIYSHDSVSKTYDRQQPPALVPQAIPAPTQAPATVLIPPATPPRQKESGATPVVRTPQQADRSRLAKDIEEAGVSPENLPVAAEHQQETPP